MLQHISTYHPLPRAVTKPKPPSRYAGLARIPVRIGGFGLVWVVITIAYHVSILGQTFELAAFTNLYHRGLDRGIDVSE